MDPWTFNQKNLMKCCKEFLLPGGVQIPFCAYNTLGYREQARKQLEARERGRNRARRAGEAYTPEPITFSFERHNGPSGPSGAENEHDKHSATRTRSIQARPQTNGAAPTDARTGTAGE